MKLTKEQCEKLRRANNAVQGTRDYTRYKMECHLKTKSGHWKYISWSIPYSDDITVKTFKGVTYLYEREEFFDDTYRYTLTHEVKKLLNI